MDEIIKIIIGEEDAETNTEKEKYSTLQWIR